MTTLYYIQNQTKIPSKELLCAYGIFGKQHTHTPQPNYTYLICLYIDGGCGQQSTCFNQSD